MDFLNSYAPVAKAEEIATYLNNIKTTVKQNYTKGNLKLAFNCIDLTTLNTTDTQARGRMFADNVNRFPEAFADMPNVAAICVYPALVAAVRDQLNDKNFPLASVVGGFPSSQTFLGIKTAETRMAVEAGATEVDMVISVGEMLSGNYPIIFDEVKAIKEAAGEAHVKVILETGALPDEDIWKASLLAMDAGADFIKTSTGKTDPAATPEAAVIMCRAIRAYYEKTGRMVGFKPAGGIKIGEDAVLFMSIVKDILGDAWLSNTWFRIGASSLANCLLSEIAALDGQAEPVAFF